MQSFSKKWSNIFLAGMVCTGSFSLFVPLSTQAAISTEHGLVDLIHNSSIQNGDFEFDGNWNFANASIVQDNLSQGRSAKINPTTNSYANGHIWQQVQLQKNTSYTLSAKVRISSDSPSTTASLVIKTGTMNNSINFKQTVVTASTNDWQTVSVSFNTGENTSFIVGLDRWIQNATA